MCACQELAPVTTIGKGVTVGFVAGGHETRTSMDANGLSASWEEGDRVALWAKTASGSYALSGKVFHLYGLGDGTSVFTATLQSAMEEGTYNYYVTYPVPESLSGTKATFTIPSLQDGKVSGGADILVGTPVEHGALKTVPEVEDHSGLYIGVNHILHQFRFYLPEEAQTEGESVQDIILTMPADIAGKITADFTDPNAAATLASGTKTITLNLAEPISQSTDRAEFACVSVFPSNGAYGPDDYMNLVAYTKTLKFEVDPISLDGREFLAGHSTPVRLLPTTSRNFYRITLTTGKDYIGEPLTTIRVKSGDTVLYTYNNVSGQYDNLRIVEEFLDESGRTQYEALCNAVKAGSAVLEYETEHALVTKTLSPSALAQDGNIASLTLGDVPYLLHESFDNAVGSANDDDYTAGANTDRNVTGYLINDGMETSGWNASRYSVVEGDCVRLNVRYQSGAWVVERWAGRLDTPSMAYLKSGASVSLVVEFDEAFYVPAGYNYDDSGNEAAYFILGTHTNDQNSALNGMNQDKIPNYCTVQYTSGYHKSEDVSQMTHNAITVNGCTSATRFVFWPCTTRNTRHIAANTCTYMYVDNIKVYIK